MSYLTLSGAFLARAVLRLPLVGAWVADVEHLDPPSVAVGESVTLVIGSQSWVGTVVRAETAQGRTWDTRVVGGAGGLGQTLTPKQYRSPPASLVAADLLSEVGESLAAASSLTLVSVLLRAWVRRATTAGQAMDDLTRPLGYHWRVLPSGDVWVGTDTGDAVSLEEFEILEEDAARGLTLVACSEPTVTPGQTWTNPQTGASYEVGTVVHRVSEQDTRTEIWAAQANTGRLGEMIGRLARGTSSPDLYAPREYTVVVQNLDGTFELRSGDPLLPDLSRVPYYPGGPGETYTVAPGARCMVAFRGGSPDYPLIDSWISATTLTHSWRTASATISNGGVATDALKEGTGFHSQMGASLTEVAAFMAAFGIPATATTTLISSLAALAFRSTVLEVE